MTMFDNNSIGTPPKSPDLRRAIADAGYASEESCVRSLYPVGRLSVEQERQVSQKARHWLLLIRARADGADPIETLLTKMNLGAREGLALMALAEALPRVPDDFSSDALIAGKLAQGNWRNYLKDYPDLMSKLAWLGLSLGKDMTQGTGLSAWISRISAAPLREAVRLAMKKLGAHFVLGATIEQAINRSQKLSHPLQRFSYDMLGEAARTQEEADRYFKEYKDAIVAVAASPGAGNPVHGPAVSVKLSALHPRYNFAQHERVISELTPRLMELIETAVEQRVGLTIDAEECERLELSLALIEKAIALPALKNYQGFSVAVQAYQKRAPAVIDWLYASAKSADVRMGVRLVKGAYWDSEIKRAQELGLAAYPVYTRRSATDIAYLACAKKLLENRGVFYPQFGTHNLRTALSVAALAGETRDYEFQRLHGMGTALHKQLMDEGHASCVYTPVGPHKELLSYLIRRLMENGANSSFVNQLNDPAVRTETLLADPFAAWDNADPKPHPAIPLPANIYGKERLNATGPDLSDPDTAIKIETGLNAALKKHWEACPIIEGQHLKDGGTSETASPADKNHITGQTYETIPNHITLAMESLAATFPEWMAKPVNQRAIPFEKLAHKIEEDHDALLSLLCFEAGKTIPDALAEIREAVDYCRYYSMQARRLFGTDVKLEGVSGEENHLAYEGRGVFVAISPWNFPLAIFLGQITAALLAGNTVAAKPAEQTPLIAAKIIHMLLSCGLPREAIALLPGDGAIGEALVKHPATSGVVFTGSFEVAKKIQKTLADKKGSIVPFIAETGGVNALIADSSALPEQLVDDVIKSAFHAAGQRCSSARLLCIQDSIAEDFLQLLKGAIGELSIGPPYELSTDVGPVIDAAALEKLQAHEQRLKSGARLIAAAYIDKDLYAGNFFAPQAWEIPSSGWLEEEVFGPILHVARFRGENLPALVDSINRLGYGLTGGLHSRIDRNIDYVKKHLRVGNLYINRSIIGAVVGAQPFGGVRLSGTGSKAGGPNYLQRFAAERTITDNIAALGGSPDLLRL